MSWLARSIANSLKFDDDDDVSAAPKLEHNQLESNDGVTSPSRGVKEDLSEISKTLTRQFWGVASYLAPPPQPEPKPAGPDAAVSDQGSILGIRSDFAEIGGKFRSGISRLSTNINVSEITKLASNLLQLESDDENEGVTKMKREDAVGVTEEVVAFSRDIAMHPETWLDFQLPENVDFDMTDAQQEHVLAVERLSPTLGALRIELCPGYMTESRFWMIYFVLLHPRLDKKDAEFLSTPQVMEIRSLMARELKSQNTTKPEHLSMENSPDLIIGTSTASAAPETVHNSVEKAETQTADKSITEDKGVDRDKDQYSNVQEEEDADAWLKEETSEVGGKNIPIENEDVSFSDLEDDEGDFNTSYRRSNYSSDKDSRDWVQLGKSSSDKESGGTKESNDWLDVDDIGVS